MNIFIVFLRGINVSGQKKIKMAALREQIAALGYKKVTTYIQSGNIVLQTEEKNPEAISQAIKAKILKDYGFEVNILTLFPDDLNYALLHNPFESETDIPLERTYVMFLDRVPDQEKIKAIDAEKYLPERFIIDKKYLFFYSPKGYGNAKMNNNFFESKLKIIATTRNWRTVNKMMELVRQM